MKKGKGQEINLYSDDDLNEQINDKLNQLWTGMKNKKKQLIRNLTPHYSRRSERTLSELNATQNQNSESNHNRTNEYAHNRTGDYANQSKTGYTCNQSTMYDHNSNSTENQLLKIKQKLASEESARKNKEGEIDKLKNIITQLTNDKKILAAHLQNGTNHSISICNLNQSSIEQLGASNIDGKTANFSTNKKKHVQMKKQKSFSVIRDISNKQNRNDQNKSVQEGQISSLQDLSKDRLIQLLKSTSEYRQFAFYYDSHELSYLKRLQVQHKKNCVTNHSKMQQRYWAPTELIRRLKQLNKRQNMSLNQNQIEQIVGEMKYYFECNQQQKIKQMRESYQKKIDKLKRQKGNNIPYDLVRLSNAKEREISQQANKKRTKSIKS